MELCDRYGCALEAVGLGSDGGLACYYHESKGSYLERMKELAKPHSIPSNVSPNDPTWRNP